jgi:hypothetical protein
MKLVFMKFLINQIKQSITLFLEKDASREPVGNNFEIIIILNSRRIN